MKRITVNKIIGYKRWMPVEVIEGSDEHKELIRWNRAMNFRNKQDRKEMEVLNEKAQYEISADQLADEKGVELVDVDEPSPEEWYIQNEINDILWDAVQELPENQREIIILHFYQGYSLRDISRRQGKRLFAVQKSFQSALDKLRTHPILKNYF